ncbi:PilZ domain-containing protein [Pararhodobacter sp. SW119]|uniref:PilZ domain-containing protein n=1 Tax=Pararhodobacter sp. SW119 TaxID=2780075 RepID=UPI001AE0584D|nr:PilZ domain-containing protein [Pararhodobacter sp. SW119]
MRYREMRWPCDYPVLLLHGGQRASAVVVNVSSGGARLRTELAVAVGEVLTVDLGKRRFAGTVRWVRSGMIGLRLLTPLSKPDLATIRRGRENADAVTSGRWNTHLHELR